MAGGPQLNAFLKVWRKPLLPLAAALGSLSFKPTGKLLECCCAKLMLGPFSGVSRILQIYRKPIELPCLLWTSPNRLLSLLVLLLCFPFLFLFLFLLVFVVAFSAAVSRLVPGLPA